MTDARDLLAHYASGYEASRLDVPAGRLELLRTLDLLERHLPAPPARILDVGGGPGRYAELLRERGYDPERLAQLLALLRRVEAEPALLGVSAHLFAVGVRAAR